jgi:hypothetical protein
MKRLVLLAALLPATLEAEVPSLLHYQGRLAQGTNLVNETVSLSLRLYDAATLGNLLYEDSNSVAVADGLYSTFLGDDTNFGDLGAALTNAGVWIEVAINNAALTPRERVTAVAYALVAAGVKDGGITSAMLASGAVQSVHLAAGSVGAAQMASGAVQAAHLAAGAVGSNHLAAGSVHAEAIATGAVGFAQLARPPQAGTVEVNPLADEIWPVAFPEAYGAPPVVTLTTLEAPRYDGESGILQNTSATGFALRAEGVPSVVTVLDGGGTLSNAYGLSFAIVSSNPACSFNMDTGPNSDLYYLRASNIAGTSWGPPVLVTTSGLPLKTALAVVNGNPAICFGDNNATDLRFVRALNATGTTWGAPLTVDSNYASQLSVAMVHGTPAIAYRGTAGITNQLRYVRALDADGAAWGAPVVVSTGSFGQGFSLLLVGDRPAIAFTDDYRLKFVRAADTNGAAWPAPVAVETSAAFGAFNYPSMQVIHGNPAISYHAAPSNHLRYVRAADPTGTTWNAPVTVVTNTVVHQFTSMGIVATNPAIAYGQTNFPSGLYFVRATDAAGNNWGAAQVLDADTGLKPEDGQLGYVDGDPGVAYLDGKGGICHVRSKLDNASTWSDPTRVFLTTNGHSAGNYLSAAAIGGRPAVAYRDDTAREVRFALNSDARGTGTWTITTVQFPSYGIHISMQEVNGAPALCYGTGFTVGSITYSRALNSLGTAWSTPTSVVTGARPSLQVVNGRPALTYYMTNTLSYIRATNAAGTGAWGAPVTLATNASATIAPLAIIGGNPAVLYTVPFAGATTHVYYVRATDPDGATWGTPVGVMTTADSEATALIDVGGTPQALVRNFFITSYSFRVYRGEDASGTSWSNVLAVSGTQSNAPAAASLAEINGRPALLHAKDPGPSLHYLRAQDPTGSAWTAAAALAPTSSLAAVHNALIAVSNRPVCFTFDSVAASNLVFLSTAEGFPVNWIALPP